MTMLIGRHSMQLGAGHNQRVRLWLGFMKRLGWRLHFGTERASRAASALSHISKAMLVWFGRAIPAAPAFAINS